MDNEYKIENIVINEDTSKKFFSNTEYKKFFLENFIEIINAQKSYKCTPIGLLCKDDSARKIIFENLPIILSKMEQRSIFPRHIVAYKNEVLLHAKDFFVKDLTGTGVNYWSVIGELEYMRITCQ